MKYLFILRAVKPKQGDIFGLFPNDEHVYFFCSGLKDLRNTIRHITPLGYRVKTSAWFSKYLKLNNYDLVLNSGFLVEKETYRIIKVDDIPTNVVTIEYENRNKKTYPLKTFTSEIEIERIKSLFN